MGLVSLTFDLLTLKLVRESHQRWETFLPNLRTLGLWVLELFAVYATDGQTNIRTDRQKQRLLSLPYRRGIITEATEKLNHYICDKMHRNAAIFELVRLVTIYRTYWSRKIS